MRTRFTVSQLTKYKSYTIGTAESCTGGAIAKAISSVPGSSSYFRGSIVAYAEDVKTSLLGVSPEIIEKYGVVSEEVVEEMAKGCRNTLSVDFAVSTSGIAGPGGGTIETPVGTVCISVAGPGFCEAWTRCFEGGRSEVVAAAMSAGLDYLEESINRHALSVG